MNKTLIISTVIVILVLGGGGLFIANQQSSTTEEDKIEKEKDAMVKDDNSIVKDDSMTENDSRYVAYSKSVLDNSSDRRRVLYFYASWCPICRPANEDFIKNSGRIPKDTVVIRVNYNDPDTDREEKDLAKKYGITYQHTFVQIDSLENEITKWSGGQIEELLANIK